MCSLPQGQQLSWKPDLLQETQQRNLFVPWRTWHCLCCPHHMEVGLGSLQGEAKKGPRPFPQGLFPPQALGILFLPLKVQFLSMRQQQWATRNDANINGEVGTALQDYCLTSWLSPWRIVSCLIRGPTSGSLDRLGQGSPTSEALREVKTQSKKETDTSLLDPGFLWEAGIKRCPQWWARRRKSIFLGMVSSER